MKVQGKNEIRKGKRRKLHLQELKQWMKVLLLGGEYKYCNCLGSRICPSIWGACDRRRRGSVRRTHHEGVVPGCEHGHDGQPTGRHHGGSRRLFLPGLPKFLGSAFSANLGGPDYTHYIVPYNVLYHL